MESRFEETKSKILADANKTLPARTLVDLIERFNKWNELSISNHGSSIKKRQKFVKRTTKK